MSNYKQIIRYVQAVSNNRPAPERVVRTKFISKSSDAWDAAPSYDVDQTEYNQEGFWDGCEDEEDLFLEDPCVFF